MIILVQIISFWPLFAGSVMWWKILLLWITLVPLYVYGVAGVYLLFVNVKDAGEFVSTFPAVMVPYFFFSPLYMITGNLWSSFPLAIWSGYLELLVVASRGKSKDLWLKIIVFKFARIGLFFLVMSR